MKKLGRKNKYKKAVALTLVLALVITGVYFLDYFNLIPKKYYNAKDFGIETVKSQIDFNNNGVDDYTDIMLGARKDAQNKPKYDGKYIDGGYPPEDIGVCSDVVWRAFKNAGYNLREMVDNDIKSRPEAYTQITKPDTNIDFRRVRNLRVFFDKYAISLTTDIEKIDEWQPGDIIIFNDNSHIGIVSDKRNRDGNAYIIHNGGQPNREEDYLKRTKVVAHYRFDASKIDSSVLIPW
jgi:uncharacterized protein YijF (DUF1287 family)